jgi:subtilisin
MSRSRKQRRVIIFIATLVLAISTWQAGITPTSGASTSTAYFRGMTASTSSEYSALMQRAVQHGSLRVIVMFKNVAYNQRSAINTVQSSMVSRLQGTNYTLLRQFQSTPALLLQVDPTALQSLINDPSVASVTEDGIKYPTDTASNAVIGTANAYAQGYDGTGQIVAIFDSGVQTTHPFFTGRIQDEACFSTTDAGQGATSLCPNGQETTVGGQPGQTGTGAGVNCSTAVVSSCFHGTHVAGIAAGKNFTPSGPGFDGVAKGAKIIAVQVFTLFSPAACGSANSCIGAFDSDILSALDYVFNTFSVTYPTIASINMSLGSDGVGSTTPCTSSPYETPISNLRNTKKIATVISAGNDAFSNQISFPGCVPSAISVGSTTNADAISSFSNRAYFLSIFAPGSSINSSTPTNTFGIASGTSMAAPHVAGAWAVMKSKSPNASVSATLSILRGKGAPITFNTNPGTGTISVTVPRLQLDTALRDYGNINTIGIFRPSTANFYLRYTNTTGVADKTITFGTSTDLPIVGDWNGDGIETPGLYRNGLFILSDNTSNPASATYNFALGIAGDTPIVGDWDGDGKDGVGVFRPSNGLIYTRNTLTTGFADFTMVLGIPGDVGLAGDWNGDGKDSPGVYRPSNGVFYLTNQLCNCGVFADSTVSFGLIGDQPFVGDWNGDGMTGLGAYRSSNGLTYLRNNPNTAGFADYTFVFGSNQDKALGGAWQITVPPPSVLSSETAPPFVPNAK